MTAEMAEADATVGAEAGAAGAAAAPDEASDDAKIKPSCAIDWKCCRKKIVKAQPVVKLPG